MKVNNTKIKLTKHRYAIICTLNNGTEYIYKDYANKKSLTAGEDRLSKRLWKPKYRIARLKVTTEEVN